MQLKRVIRLDSTSLNRTFFTSEGYLVDRPILTSTGIFEYGNPDGSVRRELRLPEEVFDPDSLASYAGKPVVVTHDAGLISKDNVHENQIGTILTQGYRDGDDVRAQIIIHDTDEMKDSGLKELSLGYNLDLDETPGEWNGEPYDAIQRNIRINHLALVREARAGEQARLNIDSRESNLKGAKAMRRKISKARRADGVLSPEELKKAIEEYKARHAGKGENKDDDELEKEEKPVIPEKAEDDDDMIVPEEKTPEEKIEEVKANKDRRDEEGKPEELEEANKVIAHQDEDIQTLIDIIDTLLAEKEFDEAGEEEKEKEKEFLGTDAEEEEDFPVIPEEEKKDCGDEEEENTDEDDDVIPSKEKSDIPAGEVMNADSIDKYVRARIKLGVLGQQLNMDGLENMKLMAAKKRVIKAVRPSLRLDGKSRAYIDAMFDYAYEDIQKRSRKDTSYQRSQMFNNDSRSAMRNGDSASAARQRMIDRRQNKKEEK